MCFDTQEKDEDKIMTREKRTVPINIRITTEKTTFVFHGTEQTGRIRYWRNALFQE